MDRHRTTRFVALLVIAAGTLCGCHAPASAPEPSKVEFTSTQPVKTAVPAGGTVPKGVAPTEAFPAPPGTKTGNYQGGLR